MGAGDLALSPRKWERESFDDFWLAVRDKTDGALLKCLNPQRQVFYRLENCHVALETHEGLSLAFVTLSVGPRHPWWVRHLADWLASEGIKRLAWYAQMNGWGALIAKRWGWASIKSEPSIERPGWALYECKLEA
jgi:hypothetical protein